MPDDPPPFTEEELEALAREQGKPVRKGFEQDVLNKVRSRQRESESKLETEIDSTRLQELEDSTKRSEKDAREPVSYTHLTLPTIRLV